jgi:AraC family transcriptional regulator
MAKRGAEILFSSPLMRIGNVLCRERRSGPGVSEWTQTAQIVLPLRGVFCVHRAQEQLAADVNTALLFGADVEYRVSHPADAGDECAVLIFPSAVLEDALAGDAAAGQAWCRAELRATTRLAALALTAALRRGVVDQLEAEESGLRLLGALARDLAMIAHDDRRQACRLPRSARALEDVRLLLASSPSYPWQIADLARAVHYSPFHLARVFRAATGVGVHQYLVRLRVGLALDRLARGERDLAALATALGFAHHSHFTASFRSAFGTTPAAVRECLTKARLHEMRTILTAPATLGSLECDYDMQP